VVGRGETPVHTAPAIGAGPPQRGPVAPPQRALSPERSAPQIHAQETHAPVRPAAPPPQRAPQAAPPSPTSHAA